MTEAVDASLRNRARVPETRDAEVTDDVSATMRLKARDSAALTEAVDVSATNLANTLERVELTDAEEVNERKCATALWMTL